MTEESTPMIPITVSVEELHVIFQGLLHLAHVDPSGPSDIRQAILAREMMEVFSPVLAEYHPYYVQKSESVRFGMGITSSGGTDDGESNESSAERETD